MAKIDRSELLDLLHTHAKGRENARTIKWLIFRGRYELFGDGAGSVRADTAHRYVKYAIRELRNRGHNIGSGSAGVWLATGAEADEAHARLRRVGLSHLATASAMRKNSNLQTEFE